MKMKLNKTITIIVLTLISVFSTNITASAETSILRRDITIQFKDRYNTTAQLTIPTHGEAPFPCILLVQGSGACDMNEYIFQGTATGEPIRPLKQIADHLTKQGYIVLRYNKRGITTNYSKIDAYEFLGLTYPQLLSDLEDALEVLRQQPDSDPSEISIVGHSEGAYLCAIEASRNPNITNVVLMGIANHPYDLAYWQKVDLKLRYAHDIDLNKDDFLDKTEIVDTFGKDTFLTINPEALLSQTDGEWNWNPGIDVDGDNLFSIEEELRPLLLQSYQNVLTMDYPGSLLIKSAEEMDEIRDVIKETQASILLIHGDDDIVTPVSEAEMIFEVLESSGSSCSFYRYPGLSHYFYDSDWYSMAIGPISDIVLDDISEWLDETRTSYTNDPIENNVLLSKINPIVLIGSILIPISTVLIIITFREKGN